MYLTSPGLLVYIEVEIVSPFDDPRVEPGSSSFIVRAFSLLMGVILAYVSAFLSESLFVDYRWLRRSFCCSFLL